MIVREIIFNALSRLGIARHGVAPADQMEKAERILKTSLRTYSGDDIITAFQRVISLELQKAETTIGNFIAKRGKRIHTGKERPAVADMEPGKDFAYIDGEWWRVEQVDPTAKTWLRTVGTECCDYVPDVIVEDMERIVAIKVKTDCGWKDLHRTNLAQLDPDDSTSYVANPDGERRERIYTAARGACRVVYNTSMGGLSINSNVDLPEPYIALIELSICVGCARTAEQLAKYSSELEKAENNIITSNTIERCPQRDPEDF